MAQVKVLCNVILEILDNIAKKTKQKKKKSVFFFLNILGTKLGSSKPYEMLSERLQATLHRKKYCVFLS